MFKLSVKWGVLSGSVMVSVLLLSNLVFPDPSAESYGIAEVFGYVSIFASLGLIYLALREAQNKTADTAISLWQMIVIGVMVSTFAGIMFGLYNVVYTSYINPDFMENYYNHYIAQLPVQSGAEYEALVAELEQQKAMFMHPFTQFWVMGVTVIASGIPISVILALLQKWRTHKA